MQGVTFWVTQRTYWVRVSRACIESGALRVGAASSLKVRINPSRFTGVESSCAAPFSGATRNAGRGLELRSLLKKLILLLQRHRVFLLGQDRQTGRRPRPVWPKASLKEGLGARKRHRARCISIQLSSQEASITYPGAFDRELTLAAFSFSGPVASQVPAPR
jgi:hypothetical protein